MKHMSNNDKTVKLSKSVEIIELSPTRYLEYRDFKLARLLEDPQSSHVTYEEEEKIPIELWKKDLEQSQRAEGFIHLFAQINNKIVGMSTVFFEKKINRQHVVNITSVHVDKDYRGLGVGRLLLTSLLNKIKEKPHIIKSELTVNTIQTPAFNLYKSLGFKKVGKLSKTLKVNDIFYDEYIMEIFF